MTEVTSMQMCQMAGTCKVMMERPFPALVLIILAILFVALGLLLIFEPSSLFWIAAVSFVLMGAMMLIMVAFMRKLAARCHYPRTVAAGRSP